MKSKIENLAKKYSRGKLINKMVLFSRWKRNALMLGENIKISQEINKKISSASDDLKQKDKKLKELEEDLGESEKQKNRLYKVVKENKKVVADAEIDEEKLTKDINTIRSSRNRGVAGDFENQVQ